MFERWGGGGDGANRALKGDGANRASKGGPGAGAGAGGLGDGSTQFLKRGSDTHKPRRVGEEGVGSEGDSRRMLFEFRRDGWWRESR